MMHEILPWVLAVGKYILASGALLLFYRSFFRKNATYTESRVFLLSIAVAAALVSQFKIPVYAPATPFAQVEPPSSSTAFTHTTAVGTPSIKPYAKALDASKSNPAMLPSRIEPSKSDRVEFSRVHLLNYLKKLLDESFGWLLFGLYFLVLLSLSLNLALQYAGIRRLRRKGETERKDGLKLVRHTSILCPFSFGKTIFLPVNLKDTQLEVILEHERWHIQHKHYVDVLIQEIGTCIFWFNPIQWLIRKDLRSIHEFQADRSVLDKGCDLFQYQTIILEEVMGNHIRLANGFNQSFTKKRFIQMKNQEPTKLSASRKLILVPFLTFLIATFCFVPGQSQVVKYSKGVTTTGPDGKTKTVVTTMTDTLKMNLANNLTKEQSSKFLDSISNSADKMIPILKKLEKVESSQSGPLLDEFLTAMNINVNNKVLTHKDLSKDVLSSLQPSDYLELENYLKSVKETVANLKSKPQDQLNENSFASMAFVQNFSKLSLVQKLMPEVLRILGDAMTQMMQGMDPSTNSLKMTPSGRLINDRIGALSATTNINSNVSEPDPVPVYVNPYCKLSEDMFEWSKEPFGAIRLVSIEPKSSETVITLSIPIYYNQWIRFSSNTQLINKKNGDRYTIRRVENMPLNTEIFFHDVRNRMVLAKVVFPPLKKDVKIVDVFESEDGSYNEWTFRNIQISDYKPGARKASSGSGAKVYY